MGQEERSGDPGRRVLQQAEGEGPPGQLGLRGTDQLEEHGWVCGGLLNPSAPHGASCGALAVPDQPLSPRVTMWPAWLPS